MRRAQTLLFAFGILASAIGLAIVPPSESLRFVVGCGLIAASAVSLLCGVVFACAIWFGVDE